MQSFNDLNNYSATSVDYGTSADYTITFGTNAGNITQDQYEGGFFRIAKQVPLTEFSDVSKDLLINVTVTDPTKVGTPIYFGSLPNIKIWQTDIANWSITGIRTIDDYNNVFNNVYFDIPSGSSGSFQMNIEINDQIATTQTYNITVNIIPNVLFSYTTPLGFAEDTLKEFTNLQVTDSIPESTNYTMTLTVENPALGKIRLSNGTLANTFTITSNKSAVNSAVSALRFAPAADSKANTSVNVVFNRSFDNRTVGQVLQLNWNGTGHNNYIIPNSYALQEDGNISMSGISITDLRPNIVPSTQYAVSLNSSNVSAIRFNYGNALVNSVSLTGTKDELNSIFGNANTRPQIQALNDFTGTAQVTYSQTNTTDNIVQATDVPISVFVADGPDYSITTTTYFTVDNSGANVKFDYNILDFDLQAQTYTMNFSRLSGANGNFIVNSSNQGAGPITFTDTRANVNSSNITFSISSANVGNATINWGLSKTKTGNVVVPIASNVVLSLQSPISSFSGSYNYLSNNKNLIFPDGNKPVVSGAIPGPLTLTLSTSSGYFGLNDANATPNWSITGTADIINKNIGNVYFWPNQGVSSNVTATFTLSNSSTTWVNKTIDLLGSPGTVPSSLTGITELTSASGTYTIDLRQRLYCEADMSLIGGGGGGGIGRGGGGGGGITNVANVTFPSIAVEYLVGRGATAASPSSQNTVCGGNNKYTFGNGNNGTATTILSYSAGGGFGGSAAKGGNSGFPQSRTGGNAYSSGTTIFSPGGGAGAGSNGGVGGNLIPAAGGSGASALAGGTYGQGGPADCWIIQNTTTYCPSQIQNNPIPAVSYGRGGIGVHAYSQLPTEYAKTRGTNGAILINWTQK